MSGSVSSQCATEVFEQSQKTSMPESITVWGLAPEEKSLESSDEVLSGASG